MKFTPIFENDASGPLIIEPQKHEDERGFFARSFCENEMKKAGLPVHWPQSNISFNHQSGTVRGMHFQTPPHEEPKIVRVTAGAICDAVIDLRQSSDGNEVNTAPTPQKPAAIAAGSSDQH